MNVNPFKPQEDILFDCDVADGPDEGVEVHCYWDEQGNLIDIAFDRIH